MSTTVELFMVDATFSYKKSVVNCNSVNSVNSEDKAELRHVIPELLIPELTHST